MTRFQPVGEVSYRDQVIELFGVTEFDTLITYERLSDHLGLETRKDVQAVVNSAKWKLEKTHAKTVVAVPNEGYRVARPQEHLGLATLHQVKARRAIGRSLSKVTNVDVSSLTDGERAALTLAATGLALQVDYMRRNDIRAKRHEQMIEATTEASTRNEQEIAALRARLEALESRS